MENKIIGSRIPFQNASNINKAYANNTPKVVCGYAEAAYNLFYKKYKMKRL